MIKSETISLLTVPLFSGAIGYLTNWSGVWMLFNPVRFKGLPASRPERRSPSCCRARSSRFPGVMHGGVGWQGIIPSRAAKMGWIAVDKGIAKLGSPGEFYEQLEPDKIAEHILDSARGDIRDVVERIMEREHPAPLARPPAPAPRGASTSGCRSSSPTSSTTSPREIGTNIDQLLDVKLMVIRHFEEDPAMANRIFQEIGHKELRFIINFGFVFGFLLGIPTAVLTEIVVHAWWLLPICGVVVGYITNLARDLDDLRAGRAAQVPGPLRFQGLFLQRQQEVVGRLRADHRRRHRDAEQHRRGAAARPARRPHAQDDRGRDAPGGRPRGGPRTPASSAWRGHARVRRDPRVRRGRGASTTRSPRLSDEDFNASSASRGSAS